MIALGDFQYIESQNILPLWLRLSSPITFIGNFIYMLLIIYLACVLSIIINTFICKVAHRSIFILIWLRCLYIDQGELNTMGYNHLLFYIIYNGSVIAIPPLSRLYSLIIFCKLPIMIIFPSLKYSLIIIISKMSWVVLLRGTLIMVIIESWIISLYLEIIDL